MIFSEYIALIHAPFFLKSSFVIASLRIDRDLWVNLTEYGKCFQVTMRQNKLIES